MFRLKGYTRPVSLLKLKSNARSKFSSVAVSTMEKMLTPKCKNYVPTFFLEHIARFIHLFQNCTFLFLQ